MGNMRFKVGDRVLIKSIDWYNENKDNYGDIRLGGTFFRDFMSQFCGSVVTIESIRLVIDTMCYKIKEDNGFYCWVDEMIEGLVEEEVGLVDNFSSRWVNEFNLPDGYIFKDENGDVINATKIVLEKKKKEYPKTYEECREILKEQADVTYGYKKDVLHSFQKLLICRDAYWKIAGQEMGLGKPWEPDWGNPDHDSYPTITRCGGKIIRTTIYTHDCPLAFPTEEMRDAFYENFKELINECKELL